MLRPGSLFVLVDIVMPLGIGKIHPHGRQTRPAAVCGMVAQAGLEVRSQRRVMGWFILVMVGSKGQGHRRWSLFWLTFLSHLRTSCICGGMPE